MTTATTKNSSNNRVDLRLNANEKWFAIKTKYKCEKYVAINLEKKGVEVYIPIIVKVKKYARKVKTYHLPLINSYIFVRIKRDEYVKVLSTEYVITFVKHGNEIIAIPEQEIEILKRVVGDNKDLKVLKSSEFTLGSSVEIISGNLTGLKGSITEIKGKKLFVLTLENMGMSFKMEINPSLLSPI